jgi:uncharacterized damage-inducible protein DinB
MRPDLNRVPSYFHNYINQVEEKSLDDAFRKQGSSMIRFFEGIPETKVDHRYAEGKWTIKEMLQHIVDAERIFCYRALCFARKDATPLPAFDENLYADNSKAEKRDWNELVDELRVVRHGTELLFDSFDEEQLEAEGNASEKTNYVRGIGFIIVGHVTHHIKIIKERYL